MDNDEQTFHHVQTDLVEINSASGVLSLRILENPIRDPRPKGPYQRIRQFGFRSFQGLYWNTVLSIWLFLSGDEFILEDTQYIRPKL